MKGFETYFIPWLISNIAGFVLLLAASKTPRLARGLFALLFGWACWMNLTTALNTPEVYQEYASMSIGPYSDFIQGWFKEHTTPLVTAIAVAQGLIALGMLLKDWFVKLACIGAIIFLLSIAPLGVGAGFPFSLTVSIAAYLIIRKKDHNFIWAPTVKLFNSESNT